MVHDNEWNKELCISWNIKKDFFLLLSFASLLAFDMLKKIRMYYIATKITHIECVMKYWQDWGKVFLKYEHNFCASYTTHSHSFLFTHSLTYSLSYKYSSSCRLLKQNFSNFAKDKVFCVIFFLSFFVINNLKTILHDFCVRQANINKAPEIIKEKMKKHFPIFFFYKTL